MLGMEVTSVAEYQALLAIRVPSARVDQASLIREMIRGRTLVNETAVNKLARADCVMGQLVFFVMPALADDPVPGVWLDEFTRLGKRLEGLGSGVGGSFFDRAKSVNTQIKRIAADIYSGRRTATARTNRITDLRDQVTTLRNSTVTLRVLA